jgi:enterochelin esterase-like enzyme
MYPFEYFEMRKSTLLSDLGIENKSLASSANIKTDVPFSDGSRKKILIYLPKNYNQSERKIRYPTYYLLHGYPGDETAWVIGGGVQAILDQYISQGKIPPLIVIMPDGFGGGLNDNEYINSTDGSQMTETFIANDLVNYIDSQLNTRKESKWRAIGGLSTGGFGAINIGLKHQDRFGYIQSFSGYSTIEINSASKKVIQDSKETILANSPREYIGKLTSKSVKIFLGIGRLDGLYNDNVSFNKLLKDNGFKSELFSDDGIHSWGSWIKYFTIGLEKVGSDWNGLLENSR